MAETGIPEIDGEYLRQLTDAAIAAAEEDGYQRGLAERDERVRELEAVVAQVIKSCDDQRDRKLIARMCSRALAASAPAGELDQGAEHMGAVEFPGGGSFTTEASEVAATTANDATVPSSVRSRNFALSPPAEAPQESGVPSGNVGAQQIKVCPHGKVPGLSDECAECRADWEKRSEKWERFKENSPGTFRGEYERMAREWLRADMMSLYYGARAGATSNELRVASLTALLARVAGRIGAVLEKIDRDFPEIHVDLYVKDEK